MKKLLFFTCFLCLSLAVKAQDLALKIPKNAKAVISLKGKNITDLVAVPEFENSKIGKLFFKEILKTTDGKVSNLNELGIDLNRDFYYYMESDSTGFKHNFLAPLKNKDGFESLISDREKEKTITEGGVSYFIDSYDDIITMWDSKTLLVTILQTEDDQYNDYSYHGEVIEEAAEEVVMESVETSYPVMTFKESTYDFGDIIIGDVVEHTFKFTNTGDTDLLITNAKASCGCTVPSYSKTPIVPGGSGEIKVKFNSTGKSKQQTKTITITANTESGTERLKIKTYIHPKGTEIEETEIEEVIESTEDYDNVIEETVVEATTSNYDDDDYYEKKRKKREKLQLLKNKELIASAKATIMGNLTNGSILTNAAYVKAIGSGKDEAVIWTDNIGEVYTDFLEQSLGGMVASNYLGIYNTIDNLYGNMSLISKLNFDKTQATIKTSYTMNNEMAKYTKAMYNGKMNSNFFKYFNEDKMLGYFSVNTSTKGILEAYPDMMTTMFENSGDNEMATFIPIGMKFLSLLIDEEGAAKILRGDMLFVLTKMEEREVTYTTYEYDDNYERTEVTKTKTETLPDFLMMVTSSEKDLFHKIMNVAVKESRGEVTLAENGMYQINTNELPYTVNVMFKDNAILVGSSPTDMMAISKGTYKAKISGKHKKIIAGNSSSIYVNGKQIATKFPRDIMPRDLQERIDYIADNTEDVIFKVGKIKGNILEGEMILNTPEEGHKNSLAYFLNMVNTLID